MVSGSFGGLSGDRWGCVLSVSCFAWGFPALVPAGCWAGPGSSMGPASARVCPIEETRMASASVLSPGWALAPLPHLSPGNHQDQQVWLGAAVR